MQEKLCICHQYGKGCSVVKSFIDGKNHSYRMRLQNPPQDTLGEKILSPVSPSSTKEGESVLGTSLCQALPSGAVQDLQREQATPAMLLQSRGDRAPPSPSDPVAPCKSNNRACPHSPTLNWPCPLLPHLQRTPDLNPSHASASQSPGLGARKASPAKNGESLS